MSLAEWALCCGGLVGLRLWEMIDVGKGADW